MDRRGWVGRSSADGGALRASAARDSHLISPEAVAIIRVVGQIYPYIASAVLIIGSIATCCNWRRHRRFMAARHATPTWQCAFLHSR